jgi:hypothetical protein
LVILRPYNRYQQYSPLSEEQNQSEIALTTFQYSACIGVTTSREVCRGIIHTTDYYTFFITNSLGSQPPNVDTGWFRP